MASLKDRLLTKAVRNPITGCLEWQGARSSGGYGIIWNGERLEGAHRVSLRLSGVPLGPGQHACHRCDNPPCIEPTHLFAGSQSDNEADKTAKGRRAEPYQKSKTHCPSGHSYVGAYEYVTPSGGVTRKCRTCAIERGKERYRAERLANPS